MDFLISILIRIAIFVSLLLLFALLAFIGGKILGYFGISTPIRRRKKPGAGEQPGGAQDGDEKYEPLLLSVYQKPIGLFDSLDSESAEDGVEAGQPQQSEPAPDRGHGYYTIRNIAVAFASLALITVVIFAAVVLVDQMFFLKYDFYRLRKTFTLYSLHSNDEDTWIEVNGSRIEKMTERSYNYGNDRVTQYIVGVMPWGMPAKLRFHRGESVVAEVTAVEGETALISADPNEMLVLQEHTYTPARPWAAKSDAVLDENCTDCKTVNILPFTKVLKPNKYPFLTIGTTAPKTREQVYKSDLKINSLVIVTAPDTQGR